MKNKISKILGIGLSVGLVFGLIGALFAAPVSADLMKWGIVNTPSWEDLEILPASNILDYDIGGDGDIIYAVLQSVEDCNDVGVDGETFALVKSEDGGVTWSDITDNVTGAANLPSGDFEYLSAVAVAPDDEDWVAVAGVDTDIAPAKVWVVASQDGGDNFSYTGEVTDTGAGTTLNGNVGVYDLAVSPEVDSIHNIAIAGRDTGGNAGLFRLRAGTWLSASWDDMTAADYLGWDTGVTGSSDWTIAIAFSPNFDVDDTIVIITAETTPTGTYSVFYLQSGILETGGSWNNQAGFPNATEIKADGDTLALINNEVYHRCAGLALPADYDGSDPGARAVFLYVNAILAPPFPTGIYGSWVIRTDNNALSPVCGPPGDPLLASIDIHGDADTGKLMIGEYVQFDNDTDDFIEASCCAGVRVWHTEELDFCCPQWDAACKDPSGPYMALVMYTPGGIKEYASTSGLIHQQFFDLTPGGESWIFGDIRAASPSPGNPLDESAFSVSRDDAVSFNQLSLIDTDIDYLSDFVACPDCSTIYLSTVSAEWDVLGSYPCPGVGEVGGCCQCDSVWRSYDDGDTWERIFHGDWADNQSDVLLLRLPCDAVEDCCDQDPVAPSGTIYLGIQGTKDIFYSRDCGQCWNDPPATKIDIQDIAVESENVVYVLDSWGYVSKSTQYGRRWSDAVDTQVGSGHTITACCDQGMVLVGGDGDDPVAYSEDGGETWDLTGDLPGDESGDAHVVCDPICEGTIYAALSRPVAACGGIYRWTVNESSDWDNLDAYKYGYYGIAMGRSDGTLYAATDYIMVDPDEAICDRFVAPPTDGLDRIDNGYEVYSGVARNLTPCETACCGTEDWDYLICGLGTHVCTSYCPDEHFVNEPSALKICGCTSTDTNTILWAIDTQPYDVIDGAGNNDEYGSLWSYEDCAAKIGPTLTAPVDGAVLDCEPCAGCDAANFTLKWERMCEACSYDIQIMDADGNLIIEWVDEDIVGDPPSLFIDEALECGMTYTWKVREANTSCECVHSPWSETWSFTVAVGAADAIQLLAPTKGAMDVPINNIGFSWTSVRSATSYSFILSPNANLAGALVSQDQSTTAFNYGGPLDYGKAYYWQIIAWQDGTRLTTSSIGIFNTMAEPAAPTPPVVVEEQPAPVINIPPAEKITPTWIYAIIGIGCALAVVVIVLIVRTRRP